MEINYNVQIINTDNQKQFEDNLITEYFSNYEGKISYPDFITERQTQYIDLLKTHVDKVFPKVIEAINKFYVPTQFGFFINKNTDIPHYFIDSKKHDELLLAIRLDIFQRLETLVLLQNDTIFNEIENGYDLVLKLTAHYKDIICEHEFNYTYCQNIKDKEIDILKSKKNNSNIQIVDNEIPENDYSGKNELSAKEKLIVLDKLGIIDLLKNKLDYSDNATHLAEIIGAITGIDNTKGTLTGYCNYLIRPDHSNKNSPYSSGNTEKKAMQIYNTFKIKDKAN